jgi:hypothetical protein
MLPPFSAVSVMCQQCDDLTVKVIQFRRALTQHLDPFTTERLTTAVSEIEAAIAAAHANGD